MDLDKKTIYRVLGYQIDMDRSAVKYDEPFTERTLADYWTIRSGTWHVEEGWLYGKSDETGGGMIFSRQAYSHDLIMAFTAAHVPPSTHDLDFMWHSDWDEQSKTRGPGYVVGINGWWEQKIGFERAPDNAMYAAASFYRFEPDTEYRVLAGIVRGLCFLFINDRLVIEMRDPDPIDYYQYGLVGFETYQSKIKVKDLKIVEPWVEQRTLKYEDEF